MNPTSDSFMSVQETPRLRGQSPQERSQRGRKCAHTRVCVTVTQKGGHRVTVFMMSRATIATLQMKTLQLTGTGSAEVTQQVQGKARARNGLPAPMWPLVLCQEPGTLGRGPGGAVWPWEGQHDDDYIAGIWGGLTVCQRHTKHLT